MAETKQTTQIITEVKPTTHGALVGVCKWFSDKLGYGFLSVVSDGEETGRDVFVHHTGVRPLNSQYRTLSKGEYVSFDLQKMESGRQAFNVTGVFGGPLMCDNVPPPPFK